MWTLSGFADEISADPGEQCELLTELGIRYLEVRSAWNTNVLDLDDRQLDRLCGIFERHGLRVSSIGSPIGKIAITEDFAQHLHRFGRALEVAQRLDAPYLRLFSFFLPAGEEPHRHRDEVLRRLAALATRAAGHCVVLLHENEKHIYGDTPRRCLDLVESVGSPQLRLAWDPGNFVQCGLRPYRDGYAMLRPYLAYMQVKDAIGSSGQVVPAGEGDGEIPETLAALRADGFDGFFSLEPHLAAAHVAGGFSGPELFTRAHRAFTTLLHAARMEYR
jgi:sugar phosphate isomerase/epimerase